MQTFNLDLSIKRIVPLLFVKQRDVGTKICVVLTDNGEKYNIPQGTQFSVWFSGRSGDGNYNEIDGRSAFDIDGEKVTVELIYQMLNNPGEHVMCLVMNDENGNQTGLWNIPYFVEAIPGADSEGATEYYDALATAQQRAEEAADRAEEAADRAEVGAGYSIIVGLDEGDVATHTASEIYNAIQNKQTVVYCHDDRLGSEFISLKMASPSVAVFSKTGYPTEFDIFNIEINAQGAVSYETTFGADLVKHSVSYNPQNPTPEQQAQARDNIKAATIDDTKAGSDAWSSKNTVDRLCPAFTESGAAVACEPVEGYPLEVVSHLENKNLMQLDTVERIEDKGYWNWEAPVTFEGVLQAPFTISCDYSQADTSSSKFAEGAALLEFIVDGEVAYVTGKNIDKNGFTVASGTLTKITAINWCEVTGTVKLQLEKGTTATPYVPHAPFTEVKLTQSGEDIEPKAFTMDLGQEVYGGHLNWNTGVLTIDWYFEEIDGVNKKFGNRYAWDNVVQYPVTMQYGQSSALEGNIICSHFVNRRRTADGGCYSYAGGNKDIVVSMYDFATLDEANAWLVEQKSNGTPLTFCYEMYEPITIQLTPQEITALSGTNILSSDTGVTEVAGRANPVAIIANLQSRLAALEAAVVNNA